MGGGGRGRGFIVQLYVHRNRRFIRGGPPPLPHSSWTLNIMEVGVGRLYTYRYTVTTSMSSALKWAAMRAILMRDKVTRQCPQIKPVLKKTASRSGISRTEVQPNSLPLGQTDSHNRRLEEGCCTPMLGVWSAASLSSDHTSVGGACCLSPGYALVTPHVTCRV